MATETPTAGPGRRRQAAPSPRAVRHAWELARAHGHHWASSATPEALAWGRAIRALWDVQSATPWHADRSPVEEAERAVEDAKAAYDAASGWLSEDEMRELAAAGRLSISALTRPHPPRPQEPVPPRTVEEAEALSALPAGPIGGIGFSLGHITGTGRLGWEVDPATGSVTITVYRPEERPCLTVRVRGDLRRMSVEVGPAALRSRHVEAANDCLRALGLPALDPHDARLADEAGRTPAWWDAVEGEVAA